MFFSRAALHRPHATAGILTRSLALFGLTVVERRVLNGILTTFSTDELLDQLLIIHRRNPKAYGQLKTIRMREVLAYLYAAGGSTGVE